LRKHSIRFPLVHEETNEPLRRNVLANFESVTSLACFGQGSFIDVGGKDLDERRQPRHRELLVQEDGNRIGFLARSAPRYPDAYCLSRFVAGDDARNYMPREVLEHLGIAEELRDPDENLIQ